MSALSVDFESLVRLRIFISYSWRDGKEAADALHSLCIGEGYVVWLDRNNLRGGDVLLAEIKDALDKTDIVLAVMTPGSFSSPICISEREYASLKEKVVIPVLLDAQSEIGFGLERVLWRLWPRDIADLVKDLAEFEAEITPHQLGPSLNRFSPGALLKRRTSSLIFRQRPSTTGLMRLLYEIKMLSELLATLQFNVSKRTHGTLAIGLVQRMLRKYVIFNRITDRDLLAYFHAHHLDDRRIGAPVLKILAEHTLAPIKTILENKMFGEHPGIVFGDSGVNVIYSLITLDNIETRKLPAFQHRGLDAAVDAMKLIEPDGELMSDVMLHILLSPTDANTKTIVAHLARRFRPFGERVGSQWERVVKRAVKLTQGTERDLLDVEHNVNYAAAMHGAAIGIENILSIESDPLRLEAIISYNKNVSKQNFAQLLKMLKRKGTSPDKDEEWVKPWAAKLFSLLK